jgi:regulator of extracellular matrix RemA (YlzA/DUF370 family)
MAHDPDWDDGEVPPSLDELYREKAIRVITINKRNRRVYLTQLNEFCLSMMQSESVTRHIFQDVLHEKTIQRIKKIILECAEELIDTVIFDILSGRVDETVLYTIAAACLSIAIKIFGAYDWINENKVVPVIVQKSAIMNKVVSKRKMILIESDILRRTDWKGCASSADIDRIYEEAKEDEDEVVYQPSAENMIQNRLEEIRRYRIQEKIDPDLDMYTFTLGKFYGRWAFKREDGFPYTSGDIRYDLSIDTAIVNIKYTMLEEIAGQSGESEENVLKNLLRKVIRGEFHIRHGEIRVVDDRPRQGNKQLQVIVF